MSIINEIIQGDRRAICQGYVYLDEEGILREYNESAKSMIGEYKNANFLNSACGEEAQQEMNAFFEHLKQEGNSRAILLIKDVQDKPRLVDLSGSINMALNYKYEVHIWDLSNLESEYDFYFDKVWKYRLMLGLGTSTYFDYNLETQDISFYRYVTRKSVTVYRNSFDEFRKEIVEYAEAGEDNIAAIETLCQQLYDGFSTIETVIRTALFHKDKKVQRMNVQARYDEMSGHRMMYGSFLATDDTLDDVPYYMTTAGLDPMTGLLNKRSLVEYTEDLITNPVTAKKPHYMVLIDIDDFKNINDNFGHQVGDKAIQLVANMLKENVKDRGIIGRFGGDEFYVFTDNIDTEEKMRSILRTIRSNVISASKDKLGIDKLTLTMGVALYPDMGHSYKELFELADKCLYIAKEKGKNRYIIYRPDLHQNIQVGAERKGISSFDEQSKAINTVVRDMFLEGRDAIGDSLNMIVKGFDLDNIDIYYGKNLIALYNCGKYSSDINAKEFIENQRYMEMFDSSGLYVLNNISNLKKPVPDIYNMLQQKNCMSMIQLALPNPDMPEYFISFNMLNRVHRWSETEISNLSLFGTIVYETIKSRR